MRPMAALGMALAASGCGLRENREAKLHDHQLRAAKTQYDAATGNLQRCVAAKLVAVAYADLGNAADAQAWRTREQVDCQAAYTELGPVTDMGASAPAE